MLKKLWFIIAFLAMVALVGEQQPEASSVKQKPVVIVMKNPDGTLHTFQYKEISSVWNLNDCFLSWEASYTPKGKEEVQATTYKIDFHRAIMEVNGEKRRFSRQEAQKVHDSLHILFSLYTMESADWWNRGLGDKVKDGEDLPDILGKHEPFFFLNSLPPQVSPMPLLPPNPRKEKLPTTKGTHIASVR